MNLSDRAFLFVVLCCAKRGVGALTAVVIFLICWTGHFCLWFCVVPREVGALTAVVVF